MLSGEIPAGVLAQAAAQLMKALGGRTGSEGQALSCATPLLPPPGGGGQLTVPVSCKGPGAEESPHSGNQGSGRKPAGREPELRSRNATAAGYEDSGMPRRFPAERLKRPSSPEQAREAGGIVVP
jgi:hypothetical protein